MFENIFDYNNNNNNNNNNKNISKLFHDLTFKSLIKKEKKNNFKSGILSSNEENKINECLCEYAFNYGYKFNEILNEIININKNEIDSNPILIYINKNLPLRSNKIIFNFLMKNFENKNKEENDFENEKISLNKIIKLLTTLNEILNGKLIKNKFEFVKNLMFEEGEIFLIKENKIKIDENLKKSFNFITKNFIIKNIFDFNSIIKLFFENTFIDYEKLGKILNKSTEKIKKYFQIFKSEFKIDLIIENKKDLKMINFIIHNDYDNFNEINFDEIKNFREKETNKKILEKYIKENDIYNVKEFKENIQNLKENLDSYKIEINKDLEKKYNLFGKDFKKRKNSDFEIFYTNFLNKKRKNSFNSI